MRIKKYCLIAFIESNLVDLLKNEVKSISNEPPSYSYIKNNFFITFSSAFELGEIENLLSEHEGLVFFLFKNDENNLTYNLPNRIKKHLFGGLCVNKSIDTFRTVKEIKSVFNIEEPDLIEFTQEDKIKIIDEILDRGLENINEQEKHKLKSLFENNKELITNQ